MKPDQEHGEHDGKKYYLNIEGKEYPWADDTIMVDAIRNLGGLPSDQPVIQETPDGVEVTLVGNEVVKVAPGHRYGRAPKYRRG